ncbi:protein jag [Haliangium sp.]|uniref:Jag family protein n=1 Tax=Haliangium sp. TaxID=2663208 RepID=UPI003D0F5B6A
MEEARSFLAGILERMNIYADIETREEGDRIVLDIQCDDADRVIGKRGQLIDALQHLVSKVSFRTRHSPESKPVIVDADGYRTRQIDRLVALAERKGAEAIDTREIVELNPMSAHDRRVVHMALAEMDGVTTRSEGEGEDRRVLIVPVSVVD